MDERTRERKGERGRGMNYFYENLILGGDHGARNGIKSWAPRVRRGAVNFCFNIDTEAERLPRERWSRSFTMVILLWQYCRRNISSPAIYCRARGKGNIKEKEVPWEPASPPFEITQRGIVLSVFHPRHIWIIRVIVARLNVDRNSWLYYKVRKYSRSGEYFLNEWIQTWNDFSISSRLIRVNSLSKAIVVSREKLESIRISNDNVFESICSNFLLYFAVYISSVSLPLDDGKGENLVVEVIRMINSDEFLRNNLSFEII